MNVIKKKENKMILTITEKGFQLGEGVNFADFLHAIINVTLTFMMMLRDQQETDEGKKEVEGVLYDAFNVAASNLLYAFAPDEHLRPDIDNEAILAMENQMLDEAMQKDPEKAAELMK